MTIHTQSIIGISKALVSLLRVIAWPFVAMYVLIRFNPEIRKFIGNLAEISLKGWGLELAVRREEIANPLTDALISKLESGADPKVVANNVRKTFDMVAREVTPTAIRRAERSTILWVDDEPENNKYERRALRALGIHFVCARSTSEAMEKAQSQEFDLIISDMNRPPDTRAGYTLLRELHVIGNQTPFVIYCGKPEHCVEARNKGAIGCTTEPNELFRMVLSALR